jgi:hypothetical protein
LTDDAELRTTVLENLEGAVANGYASTLLTWTDAEIAQDMINFGGDLEDQTVEAMVPHIAEWRKSMADREIPEGDDDNNDLAEMLGGRGARVVGPIMATGGMLRQLLGGGEQEQVRPPSKKAQMIDQMLESAENIGELLNMDRCDGYTPTDRPVVSVPGAHAPTFAVCDADAEGTDQHVYVLARDEGLSLKWRLWSLCPSVELATPMIVIGDVKRALHRLNIFIDLANNKLSREDFYVLATGKPAEKTKKAASSRMHRAH